MKQYLKLQLDFSCFFQASWHKVLSFTTILAGKILRKIRYIMIANQEPVTGFILLPFVWNEVSSIPNARHMQSVNPEVGGKLSLLRS